MCIRDRYEGAWLPDFTVWEGNGWGFPAFQRKSYGFGYEDVTGTFGVSGDSFLLELAPQGEPSLYLRTMGGTGRGICLYGNYSPRLLRFALWMGYGLMTVRKDTVVVRETRIPVLIERQDNELFHLRIEATQSPVSYTHLDVYKRQAVNWY